MRASSSHGRLCITKLQLWLMHISDEETSIPVKENLTVPLRLKSYLKAETVF